MRLRLQVKRRGAVLRARLCQNSSDVLLQPRIFTCHSAQCTFHPKPWSAGQAEDDLLLPNNVCNTGDLKPGPPPPHTLMLAQSVGACATAVNGLLFSSVLRALRGASVPLPKGDVSASAHANSADRLPVKLPHDIRMRVQAHYSGFMQ